MKKTWPLALLAGWALGTGSAAAQLPYYDGPVRRLDWPAGPTVEDVHTRVVSGRILDPLSTDAVILTEGRLFLRAAPNVHQALIALDLAANDVAVIPGASLSARLDVVAAVGAQGLLLWRFDGSSGLPIVEPVEAVDWIDARRVRSAWRSESSRADLVGLAADGQTILSLEWTNDGFEARESIVIDDDVATLETLDWDGDGTSDVAVVTSTGLTIVDRAGSELAFFAGTPNVDSLARLRGRDAVDGLAWITGATPHGTTQVLRVLRSSEEPESPLDLGELRAVACASGDVDRDGDDDLVISHRYSRDLVVLFDAGDPAHAARPTFSAGPGGYVLIRTGDLGPAPSNDSEPVLADLEGDGDADLLFHVGDESFDLLVLSPIVDAQSSTPRLASATAVPNGAGHDLVLTLETERAPLDARRVRCVVWREGDLGGPMESTAIASVEAPFSASDASGSTIVIAIPEGLDQSFAHVYLLQLQLVAEENGRDRGLPPAILAYSNDATTLALLSQRLLPGESILEVATIDDGRPIESGGIGPLPILDPPHPGNTPNPNPPPGPPPPP